MNALFEAETSRPTNTRLMLSEVEERGALIEDVAQHLKVSCIADVDTTRPTHRWKFLAEKVFFGIDCIEPLASAPPMTDQIDTCGFKR